MTHEVIVSFLCAIGLRWTRRFLGCEYGFYIHLAEGNASDFSQQPDLRSVSTQTLESLREQPRPENLRERRSRRPESAGGLLEESKPGPTGTSRKTRSKSVVICVVKSASELIWGCESSAAQW